MKNDKPVFVVLTPGFAADEADTTCLPFLQTLIKTIKNDFSFIKIIILTFQYPFEAKKYVWNGINVISFGGKNKGRFSRFLLWEKVWKELKHLQKGNNIAGLFSIWLGECALLGKRFGAKYDIVHKSWIVGQDARENNKYVKLVNPHPEDLIAISDFIADEFFKNYLVHPKHIITNGIDKNLFGDGSVARVIDIMGAGSLIALKQYDLFIDIIANIKGDIPKITSVIAGKGPEKNSLHEIIEQYALTANISLTDEIPYPDVLLLMQQAKIFLHTSRYEGFSMVCLEALYAGCQVISFCKPMHRDIHRWYVVQTKDEMAQKAYEILSVVNPGYGKACPYSIKETSSSIMKLFGY
jgi:glycosyltransferase involved in cell wall biosynthesis